MAITECVKPDRCWQFKPSGNHSLLFRGRITISNKNSECYQVIQDEFARLVGNLLLHKRRQIFLSFSVRNRTDQSKYVYVTLIKVCILMLFKRACIAMHLLFQVLELHEGEIIYS